MNRLPEEILDVLRNKGIDMNDLLFWIVCDRGIDEGFIDSYLLLGREYLIILSHEEGLHESKTFKGYMEGKKKRKRRHVMPLRVQDWQFEMIKLERISEAKVIPLVSSGMIAIQVDEDHVTAVFTHGHMTAANHFVKILTKLIEQEPLTEEDLHLESSDAACPTCGMLYPEQGRTICPRCIKKHAIFRRLLSLTAQYKGSIALIVIFMMLNSATALIIPYFQGKVLFDQALGNTGYYAGQIGLVIALIVIFRTLSLIFGVLYGAINAKLAAHVAFDLKAGVFEAMQRLSLNFFQRRQTGQLMTRVNNDAAELQYFFIDGIPYFIVNALNIIGITVILLIMDWKLTLICFLPMPIVIMIIRWVFPRLWRLSWRRHRRASRINSIISDTMRGARVVKAFGKERKEVSRFQTANLSFSDVEQTFNKMGSTFFPILNILTQLSGIIIWALGGWKVMQGDLTFGMIFTFINYMYLLYGPIQFMNNIAGWWSYCMSAAQRIFEIQDAVPEVAEKENAVHLQTMKGEIEVRNITFSYDPNKPIIKGVSMHAKPGQMIGVIGHSGAGKSTLVNLISRLYDVNSGEILIDGINVKDLTIRSMRDQIGIVSQEVYVFMASIAENIAYGNPNCTLEDIIYAAKIAHAHDFIEKMPDGYDTIVGTGGHILSGGERQRISIARAILHNPRMLILDEATASLDTETELQIQEALESLIKGRTTIAIAHRLSTLRNADVLVVMDKGQVIESGSHQQLMAKQGFYYDLVRKHDEALKMKGVG